MGNTVILDLATEAMVLTLILSMPAIIVATIAGLLVSILQALTQIQEQTLGFAVKLLVVILALIVSAQFMGGELYNYADFIFSSFHQITD